VNHRIQRVQISDEAKQPIGIGIVDMIECQSPAHIVPQSLKTAARPRT